MCQTWQCHTHSKIARKTLEDCSQKLEILGWKVKEVFTIYGEMLVKISMILPNGNKSFYLKNVEEVREESCASICLWENHANIYTVKIRAYEILGGYSPTSNAIAALLPLCAVGSSGVYTLKFVLKESRCSVLDDEGFKVLDLQISKIESTNDIIIEISGQEKDFNKRFWEVYSILRKWFFRGLPVEFVTSHKSLAVQKPVQRVVVSSEDCSAGQTNNSCEDLNLFFQAALQSQPNSEASPPDGALAVTLMRHQRIALAWMLEKETTGCPCFGGILADDQGLGKTVSTIALIVTNRPNEGHDRQGRPAAGTLIVCPNSLMRQWSEELRKKVSPEEDLSVLIYHGSSRSKDPHELAKFDVVITSYGLVTAAGPLVEVAWFRVVLDEAQTIKNHGNSNAMACYGLHAKRRWCLSGTPIQNTIDDIYSYFRFLKLHPYSSYETFLNKIKKPITENQVEGYKKLQAILKTMMLRRTKDTMLDGEPIISLPLKSIELRKLDFTKEERDFYTKLECDAREQYKEYTKAGMTNRKYAQVLSTLTRLRQACNHPLLVSSSPGSSSVEVAKTLRYGSSKTNAALDILLTVLNQSSDGLVKGVGEKAIVFSQWTKMLDLLEDCLKSSSIKYRRFDGIMSVEARDKAIQDFNTLPEVSVMIMSLKAASVGLNLVAACHVVMLDLWWNPTTEDQAIDRTHRIGQTRPVRVVRLIVKDTIEDRVLALQQKKRAMVALAIGVGEDDDQPRFSINDLHYLLAD